MDTRKCQAFLRVVERGQLSKAADDLGYTQSALSQMISSLEAEVGVRLLDRSRTGSRLTIEGRELLPSFEALVTAERRLAERAGEISGLETGVVRMGTIASISAHWLPKVIAEFEQTYPGVQFVIHQGDYALIPEWIRSGTIDFGFVNPRGVTGLATRPLKSGAMSAVLPCDHPLAAHDVVALADLASEPFILLEEGGYYEPLEAFAACGLAPHVKYTIHDDYSIMAMVSQSLGISVLADLIMEGAPYDLAVRPTDPPIERTIALAYRDETHLPIAAKRFMALLESRVSELP